MSTDTVTANDLADNARTWVRMTDVEPEHVQWLWSGRIPRGKLVVLDGDPGLGKSTLTLAIAAHVSTGTPLPGDVGEREPAGVVLVSFEDGLGDTIRPRLEAAGADLDRIVAHRLDAEFNIHDHLKELRAQVTAHGAALVIIDPLLAALPGHVNADKGQHVRRVLAPLAAMADETKAAVVAVRHLNKSTGASAFYRGAHSVGFGAAARTVLLVAADPDDDERRILAPVKVNLVQKPAALAFALESVGSVARIRWLGTTTHDASSLVAPPARDDERDDVDEAAALLRGMLTDGRMAARLVQAAARDAGVSPWHLRKARARLRVAIDRDGFGGKVYWSLPDDAGTLTNDKYGENDAGDASNLAESSSEARTPIDERESSLCSSDAIGVRPVDPFAATAPTVPCPVCKNEGWHRAGSGWVCSTCHPAP